MCLSHRTNCNVPDWGNEAAEEHRALHCLLSIWGNHSSISCPSKVFHSLPYYDKQKVRHGFLAFNVPKRIVFFAASPHFSGSLGYDKRKTQKLIYKTVHRFTVLSGEKAQWLEAWAPQSDITASTNHTYSGGYLATACHIPGSKSVTTWVVVEALRSNMLNYSQIFALIIIIIS